MKDLTPTDDAELLQRAQRGDGEAFGVIVASHQAAALRLATIISGDTTEAFDIVQEAFVRAYRAIDTIHTTESLRAWLLRIVANQAKNAQRGRWRRERRHERQAALRADPVPTPEDAALTDLRAAELLRAIARLPERDRAVLACRYFAGLTEAETAATLGVATGTVKSRTARALARVRGELAETEDGR